MERLTLLQLFYFGGKICDLSGSTGETVHKTYQIELNIAGKTKSFIRSGSLNNCHNLFPVFSVANALVSRFSFAKLYLQTRDPDAKISN